MHVQRLEIHVTDQDLNGLVRMHVNGRLPVRDVAVRVTPDGAIVSGTYPTPLFKVRFETEWCLAARGNMVAAQLTRLEVAGIAAGPARRMLLEMMARDLAGDEGVAVDVDTVIVDLGQFLRRAGIMVQLNLTSVQATAGCLVLSAEAPPEQGA